MGLGVGRAPLPEASKALERRPEVSHPGPPRKEPGGEICDSDVSERRNAMRGAASAAGGDATLGSGGLAMTEIPEAWKGDEKFLARIQISQKENYRNFVT